MATGLSSGVDSFHAIKNYINPEYKSFKLTHVCINNVGAFNDCYSDYGIERTKEERYQKTEKAAKALGLELVKTDSNFASAFPQNHLLTHTYSSMFAVFCLQKLWKIYFYGSSGNDFSKFSINNSSKKASGYYELLLLECLSKQDLRIYSEGGAENRFEKTADIADFEPARKYLHVCLEKSTNCGKCSKCKRTLLTLDALNKLDNFREVFDIDYYSSHRQKYLAYLAKDHFKKRFKKECSMLKPVYDILKNKIPLYIKILYFVIYFTEYKLLK